MGRPASTVKKVESAACQVVNQRTRQKVDLASAAPTACQAPPSAGAKLTRKMAIIG